MQYTIEDVLEGKHPLTLGIESKDSNHVYEQEENDADGTYLKRYVDVMKRMVEEYKAVRIIKKNLQKAQANRYNQVTAQNK